VLAVGARLLRRTKPEIASILGMSLTRDIEGSRLDDRPLRELGIEPRSTTDAIEQIVRTPSRT
jgi:NADH dehydrogenase